MHWTVHLEGGPRRVNHAAVAVGDRIFSFGGYCTGDNYKDEKPIDVFVLNTNTYRWTEIKKTNDELELEDWPYQRYGHTVVARGTTCYLFGGRNDEAACNLLFTFCTRTLKWSRPEVFGKIPGERDGHSACVIGDFMYIFGGYEETFERFGQDVYRLDLNTFTWKLMPCFGEAPVHRDFHTATPVGDMMLIFGGRSSDNAYNLVTDYYSNKVSYYNTSEGRWYSPAVSPPLPSGRRSHSALALDNGKVLIFGGFNGRTKEHNNDMWLLDTVTWSWSPLVTRGTGPNARRRQALVRVADKLFLFGGTSPYHGPPLYFTPEQLQLLPLQEEDTSSKLMDHDDMYVLDMFPSLKTLTLMTIIQNNISTERMAGGGNIALPSQLLSSSGALVSTDTALSGKSVIAFYFSAHWCPPCRQFTPVLANAYRQAKQAGLINNVEVIFVSSDRSQDDMLSYMRESHGDWLAIPHGSPECGTLSSMFSVRGIPALIVVTMTGDMVSRDGRQEVMSLGMSALAQWNSAGPKNIDTSVIALLEDNQEQVKKDAKEILVKLLGNIINDPNNTKYRAVKLTNKVIEEKLLPAAGAFEILFSVGFEEADDKLLLPLGSDISVVKQFRDALVGSRTVPPPGQPNLVTNPSPTSSSSRPTVSSQQQATNTNHILMSNWRTNEAEFNSKLTSCMAHMATFENPSAQAAALAVIPLDRLEKIAREKFNKAKTADNSIKDELYRDVLLLEFKEWFKTEFFSWVDSPPCPRCCQPSKACGMGSPTPEEARDGAGRVELYTCDTCYVTDIRFPRYHSKPETLLVTRKGRCGEWANCFVLCCRALGYDTRHVLDWTDHVWAEVWSEAEQRWLHVDPGETVDKPLVYEAGWGKKLTYVIAFSKDEIQDVTWRYSLDHKETKGRRMMVRPSWLVKTILEMTKTKMSAMTAEKQTKLMERRMAECLEMLTPRTVSSGDKVGRQTGSLAWRLARGETGAGQDSEWAWQPSDQDIEQGVMTVEYHVTSDTYSHGHQDNVKQGFSSGTWSCSNLGRKVETDWNMVYIARMEGNNDEGEVEWKFKMPASVTIDRVVVMVDSDTFESGSVRWQLCSDQICLMPTPGVELDTMQFAGNNQISLHATLRGGDGESAWQHTQLFRSSRSGNDKVGRFKVQIFVKKS